MGSFTCNFGINVDVNTLLDQIGSGLRNMARHSLNSRYFDNGNGRFISMQTGGLLVCMTYHKRKWHSATSRVAPFGMVVSSSKSDAPGGTWAVAYISQGIMGNQTFYDCW